MEKTNAMRTLDQKKCVYQSHLYDASLLNAVEVARFLGKDPSRVFKTLVTTGKSRYVFMVPGEKELDLKKAAKAAGEKSLEMLPQKELLPLTGYIHGGCSPIGMKKPFPTFIDQSAEALDVLCFSAGRAGVQVEMGLQELRKVVPVLSRDLVKDSQA